MNTTEEYQEFKDKAIRIMDTARMELRQWHYSNEQTEHKEEQETTVLGLKWNTLSDTLACEVPEFDPTVTVSKRTILSFVSKVFDPLGFLAPATLVPKTLLQAAWTLRLNWEQAVPQDVSKQFNEWAAEATLLKELKIPRYIKRHEGYEISNTQLHVFADASQQAYATAIFLRTEYKDAPPIVQLLMAKSRVAPLKRSTIPRLELMGCLIAARLSQVVIDSLETKPDAIYYWTDSTTALAWIKGNNNWGTFVGNRVREICKLTEESRWRHVPGENNPADLPSRGCSPKALLSSRWWEGPRWLILQPERWPQEHYEVNQGEVDAEVLKKTMTCLTKVERIESTPWYLPMSKYPKNVRMLGWIRRWLPNHTGIKKGDELTAEEYEQAEKTLIKLVQRDILQQQITKGKWVVHRDNDGILRIKTKLIDGIGVDYTVTPALLPINHLMVELLIGWYHERNKHAGAQYLTAKIREKFWLSRCRKTIQRIIGKCKTCLRHNGKNYVPKTTTLPKTRLTAESAFKTTGVDLAGPLFLKNGRKVWMVLYTCAVYRCIHLDLVENLSTESFLGALERFVNTRGRPTIIYSDNGTNFTGTANLFKTIKWERVEQKTQVDHIKWIFNPPTAAWWGGWWERLIRSVKDLLKRMLGQTRLNYEELRTCISHAERVINERPLTAVTEDAEDLMVLTPGMFMLGNIPGNLPETQAPEVVSISEEYRTRKNIQKELEGRFKREYLAMLVQRAHEKPTTPPQLGDIVLIGSDDRKRTTWPLGKVIELYPGKDNEIRVVRLQTTNGQLTRPIQRLYPLEVNSEQIAQQNNKVGEPTDQDRDTQNNEARTVGAPDVRKIEQEIKTTRSGRPIRQSKKYQDYNPH